MDYYIKQIIRKNILSLETEASLGKGEINCYTNPNDKCLVNENNIYNLYLR